ncbi:substrate-binding periplasmic protein [Rheinheimera marina]|uniref:Substrate-binding periplasmic protein n=1 Tax=Rheinheimera marina TaxID=1774958 RepID=A0ABV9JHA3_9GAMM
MRRLLLMLPLVSPALQAKELLWCLDDVPGRHHFNGHDFEGPTVDVVRQLVHSAGFELAFTPPTPLPRCLRLMEQGEVDLMARLNYSADRSRIMHLLPYGKAQPELLYQAKQAKAIQSRQELIHYRLGVVRGAVYSAPLLKDLVELKTVEIGSLAQGFAMLMAGRIDAMVATKAQAQDVLAAEPDWASQVKTAPLQLARTVEGAVYLGLSRQRLTDNELAALQQALSHD